MFPSIDFPKQTHSIKATLDIDNAYAFKNKGILRYTGSFLKDLFLLRGFKLRQRFNVFFRIKNDPYDNYHYLNQFLIFILPKKKDK